MSLVLTCRDDFIFHSYSVGPLFMVCDRCGTAAERSHTDWNRKRRELAKLRVMYGTKKTE